jgi:serine/threonine protein kinase
MDKYTLGKPLGEGAYGDVRIAYNNDTGDRVAIKTLKDKVKDIDSFMVQPEVHALRALSHPNLVRCIECILDTSNTAHLVFELMTDGNLESHCRARTTCFSEADIAAIAYQVLSAIAHVHSRNFLHRDIKPENILLSFPRIRDASHPAKNQSVPPPPIVKLADFGLAKNVQNGSNTRPNTGYVATRWYRAPEQLLRIHNGAPADVWGAGVTLAELVRLGTPLFPGKDENDQLRLIFSIRGHPAVAGWHNGAKATARAAPHMPRVTQTSLASFLPDATAPVLQLIDDLLQLDPAARPSAADAMTYPIFQMHQFRANHASRATTVNLSSQYTRPGPCGSHTPAPIHLQEDVIQQQQMERKQQEKQRRQQRALTTATPNHVSPATFFDIPSQLFDRGPSPLSASPRRLRSPAGFFNMLPASGTGGIGKRRMHPTGNGSLLLSAVKRQPPLKRASHIRKQI